MPASPTSSRRAPPRPTGRARPTPITLLTDFGLQDPYVGTMKGVILSINPRAVPVDLTHGIAPQQVAQGAFALEAAWPYFPAGTVHLAVVDPGVGSSRAAIAIRAAGHFFVGPDNGLFTPVLERCPEAVICRLEGEAWRLPRVSRTFHGRDLFAPAAAWLSRGVPLEALGPAHSDPQRLPFTAPCEEADRWRGQVVYVDVFGNLVTNLPGELIERGGKWQLEAAGAAIPLAGTYAEVPAGALLALIGSFGKIEVSVNRGSARERLGLEAGAEVVLRPVG